MGNAGEIDYGGMTVIAKAFKLADAPGQTGTFAIDRLAPTDNLFVFTTPDLATGPGAKQTLIVGRPGVKPGDHVFVSVFGGTATTGVPSIRANVQSAGSVQVIVRNGHASESFNGNLSLNIWVIPMKV